jgi:hypothetical protein
LVDTHASPEPRVADTFNATTLPGAIEPLTASP